ncbi:MAG: thioesterase family protein [Ferruginibacter sp.]|nr:thioesterase family protein [Ferruginibacter sp.]
MGRIKIDVDTSPIFTTSVKVRIGDINYGNHVGNDAFVSMINEARMQWLASKGFNELEIEGTGLIMSDLAVEFKQECFYGEIIEIVLSAGEISKVSFEIFYLIQTTRAGEMVLLAKAKTGMVSYNYQEKKVSPIPSTLRMMLTSEL